MAFTDKFRVGLGADGAQLEVKTPESPVSPGDKLAATVTIVGGSESAQVDSLTLKLVEARRYWKDERGSRIEEDDAMALEDRRHLEAGWDRDTLTERQLKVGETVDAGGNHDVDVHLDVPATSRASSESCTHTLMVQADIKGQIDPTGTGKVRVG